MLKYSNCILYSYVISLIIHEGKTKETTASLVHVVVYVIQNTPDLHKFFVRFSQPKGFSANKIIINGKPRPLDVICYSVIHARMHVLSSWRKRVFTTVMNLTVYFHWTIYKDKIKTVIIEMRKQLIISRIFYYFCRF